MAQRKRYCGIKSCENYKGTLNKERIFFRLPLNNCTVRSAWLNEIQKHQTINQPSEQMHVCDLHFHDNEIIKGCRTKVAFGAVPTIFRETNEMQFIEPKIELMVMENIKSEPMDIYDDMQPLIPRLTYSNRNRSNQATKTLSTIPTIGNQTTQIEPQRLIKVEKPDADEGNTVACIENHIQHQLSQSTQPSCTRCSRLKVNERQLRAEIDEFQIKCELIRAENAQLRGKLQRCTANALRLGQIVRYQRCYLCSSLVTAEQLRSHLCAGLTEIVCEYCADAKFSSTLAMVDHFTSAIHANIKFHKCSKCTLGFPTNAILEIHEKSHEQSYGATNKATFKCGKCDESSDQPLELVQHFEKYHPKEPTPPKGPFYECYICKCPLDSLCAVSKHLKQHVAARDTKCEICTERFTSNELMQWHVCGSGMKRKQIVCEYCDELFESVAKCMKHLKTAHANDRSMYQCRKCVRYFGMERLRDLHEKLYPHPTKSFQCDKCSGKWTTMHQLKRHMRKIHSGNIERPFLCSDCGKCYETHRNLQIHMILHAEPTIQCPDCPAKFHDKKTFARHYQWHQNLSYKCNECSRTYSKKISLQMHIRKVHKQVIRVKKYECSFCDYKFKDSDKFKTHLRSHTGERPFVCEVCHKSYRYKGDLTKHMQTHVGDNIYKCDACGQGFRRYADMKRHMFDHYRENKEKHEAGVIVEK